MSQISPRRPAGVRGHRGLRGLGGLRGRLVAPWAAIATGGATLALALGGAAFAPQAQQAQQAQVQLSQPVTVTAESALPLGLTQDRLNAALKDVRTQAPLTVRVYPGTIPQAAQDAHPGDFLVGLGQPWTEQYRAGDVRPPTAAPGSPSSPFNPGADPAADRAAREVSVSALSNNLQTGNLATAVSGAVQTWQDARLKESAEDSEPPLALTLGVAGGSVATVALLAWHVVRRRDWRRRQNEVRAGQRQVASVVVDLDALAVDALTLSTSAAEAQQQRWADLERRALGLLEWDERLAGLHKTPSAAASPAARSARRVYVADARAVYADAERLRLTSSYLGERTGGISAWDRVIAPTVLESQALTRELESGAPVLRLLPAAARLEELRDGVLALGNDVENQRLQGQGAVRRLAELEAQTTAAAQELTESLSALTPAPEASPSAGAAVAPLRADLGLPASGPAPALRQARAALAAYAGHQPPLPAAQDRAPSPAQDVERFWERPAWVVTGVAAGSVVIGTLAWVASGIVIPEGGGQVQGSGSGRVESLTVDGVNHGLNADGIRASANSISAPTGLNIAVVGVSSPYMARDRFDLSKGAQTVPPAMPKAERLALLRSAIEARPALQDPATGDLRPGAAVILVDGPPDGSPQPTGPGTTSWGDGTGGVILAVGLGTVQSKDLGWQTQSPVSAGATSDSPLSRDARAIDGPTSLNRALDGQLRDIARDVTLLVTGEQGARVLYGQARTMERLPVAALLMAGAALATTALLGVGVLVRATVRSFSPTGTLFTRIRRRLTALNLRQDQNTLESVAVLGQDRGAAAEQEQRLYAARLNEAWRRWDELDSLGAVQRRSPATLEQLEALDALVAALSEQDSAVAADAARALRALDSDGAGPGQVGSAGGETDGESDGQSDGESDADTDDTADTAARREAGA